MSPANPFTWKVGGGDVQFWRALKPLAARTNSLAASSSLSLRPPKKLKPPRADFSRLSACEEHQWELLKRVIDIGLRPS